MQQRKTILIVDDGEINRAMLRRILAAEYDTMEAENGAKALRLLEGNPYIDAVVLDLLMPVMDGFQLLNKMRSDERTIEIPVIVTSQSDVKSEKGCCR